VKSTTPETSIQSFRFAGLSAQLADEAGLYEAVALDLDKTDTSRAGDMMDTGEAEDEKEDVEGRPDEETVEEADQEMTTPAPATSTFEMAFTSSSLGRKAMKAVTMKKRTSIQSFRFAGLSAQLADEAGLYEAVALDLDKTDTSRAGDMMDTGEAEDEKKDVEGRPDEETVKKQIRRCRLLHQLLQLS